MHHGIIKNKNFQHRILSKLITYPISCNNGFDSLHFKKTLFIHEQMNNPLLLDTTKWNVNPNETLIVPQICRFLELNFTKRLRNALKQNCTYLNR